jgi:hypothetical protein
MHGNDAVRVVVVVSLLREVDYQQDVHLELMESVRAPASSKAALEA